MTFQSPPPRLPTHPVDAQFLSRWSPRAFSDRPVAEAELMSLFEAARWAPSASNIQPWRFALGLRGDAGFAAIAAALVPGNRVWAEKAAALVALASAETVARDEQIRPNPWHGFDAGTAWGHFALQAQASGLVAHAMGGFDAAALAAALHLPADHSLHAVIAVGHQGDLRDLPEALQAREHPSPRRPLTELVGHVRYA